MKKHYDVYIMVTSFFLIILFFITGVWAFSENIGDGSWNDEIFLFSFIAVKVSAITFIAALIWTFIRGWKMRR